MPQQPIRNFGQRAEPPPAPDPGAPPALPYGRHAIDEADIAAVVAALKSDHLAHGPRVGEFEAAFADAVGAAEAVACSSGTAALHLALAALDVGPGDVCVVPAITFLATATAARFCGAEVAFADVDPESGLMTGATLAEAAARARGRVKAVLPVHLGGRICRMDEIRDAAASLGARVVEDASHAVGGVDGAGRRVGSSALSAAATFSFHPVKTIAAGEGGMVTTNDTARAARMRRLRNHAVTKDAADFRDAGLSMTDGTPNPWAYEQQELGFNYRMNEMEAVLGQSQLAKLPRFAERRRTLCARYDRLIAAAGLPVRPVAMGQGEPCPHLYQVMIDWRAPRIGRAETMRRLAAMGIHTQVHYIPVYRQPYFVDRYGPQRLAGAEAFYEGVLALPLFPAMADADVDRVVETLASVLS